MSTNHAQIRVMGGIPYGCWHCAKSKANFLFNPLKYPQSKHCKALKLSVKPKLFGSMSNQRSSFAYITPQMISCFLTCSTNALGCKYTVAPMHRNRNWNLSFLNSCYIRIFVHHLEFVCRHCYSYKKLAADGFLSYLGMILHTTAPHLSSWSCPPS